MSEVGTFRTCRDRLTMSATDWLGDPFPVCGRSRSPMSYEISSAIIPPYTAHELRRNCPKGMPMRTLLVLFTSIISIAAWAGALDDAKTLGAPMESVERAIQLSRGKEFSRKDILAVFDISQPSGNRRFFLIDLKNNRTSAHYAAHGKSNGNNLRATKFRGFRSDHDMVPLGPLRTAAADAPITSHYRTIADKYTGQVWNGLNSARLEGVASYNSYINSVPGVVWVIHPNWYVSAGYRKNNPGMLGRSLGCITLDPDVNNAIVNRLGNGALIYVTVGNDPVERYL